MLFSLEACVLDKEKLGEIDYLVELLTPKGKIWAVAKGGQKSKKRFLNLLEELTLLRSHFRQPRIGNLPILEKVDPLFLSESARKDLRTYFFFSYISEVLSKISYSGLSTEYFGFVKKVVKEVEKEGVPLLARTYFEQKLLLYLGLAPQWSTCVKCGRAPNRLAFLSIMSGGVLCVNCKTERESPIEVPVLELLQGILKLPVNFKNLKNLEKSWVPKEKYVKKAIKISEMFFFFFLPFEIKSLKFLKSLDNGGGDEET